MHMDYVAIDFETANSRGDSVCSIGLSRFSDGKEVDRYYALINPRQYFSRGNITASPRTWSLVNPTLPAYTQTSVPSSEPIRWWPTLPNSI